MEGGDRFVLVDAAAGTRGEPFDHERLAAVLTTARGDTVRAVELPFRDFSYVDEEAAIEFAVADSTWHCTLADYRCENRGAVERREFSRPYPWQAGPGRINASLTLERAL